CGALGGRAGAVDAGGQVGGGLGGVDDAAAAARLHHHRGEGTTPVDHPPKVDVDNPSEVFGGGFQEGSGHTDTGVVDHQVGCSVCGVDPGGELVHGGGVGDVHPLGASPGCEPGTQFGGVLGGRPIDVHGDHACATFSQLEGQTAPDAAARTGDHGDLSGERATVPAHPSGARVPGWTG